MSAHTKTPKRIADEVMYRADLACCVCERRGDHIHHIDGDHANNNVDNLVLLCFDHHNEATITGALRRKLSPGVLRNYRTNWYNKVETKRGATPAVGLYRTVLDAVAVNEIRRLRAEAELSSVEDVINLIFRIQWHLLDAGVETRREVLVLAMGLISRTRLPKNKFHADIARAVTRVAYEVLPLWNLRKPSSRRLPSVELELLEYGIAVGSELIQMGVSDLNDLAVTEAGSELLWRILRFGRINKKPQIVRLVVREFDDTISKAVDLRHKMHVELLRTFRTHGLQGDWHYPKYPDVLSRVL